MKRIITVLILGIAFLLMTFLCYTNYHLNVYAHSEKKEIQFYANELERQFYSP